MKLKDGFILHDVGDEHMVVAAGSAADTFNGLIRNNDTADFIYRQLLEDTSEEKIVDSMIKRYDAPADVIASDVHSIIKQIRNAGFLEE